MIIEVNDVWVMSGKPFGMFIRWIDNYDDYYLINDHLDVDVVYYDQELQQNMLGMSSDFKGMTLISRECVDLGETYENTDKQTLGFGNTYKVLGFPTTTLHEHMMCEVEYTVHGETEPHGTARQLT